MPRLEHDLAAEAVAQNLTNLEAFFVALPNLVIAAKQLVMDERVKENRSINARS